MQEETNMNKTLYLVAFGVLFTVVGCGKNKMLVAAEAYEKEACACKDAACGTAASTKFAEASAKDAADVPTSGGDAEAYTKAVSNATACVTKAAMAGIPGMPAGK